MATSPYGSTLGEVEGGLRLREVLEIGPLRGRPVLAGHRGLDRVVTGLNVMEVPDIGAWAKPHELLLTTAYPLRHDPERLPDLIEELDDLGLAGLGIKVGRYVDDVSPAMLARADERGFPVILLPDGVGFDEMFTEVLRVILDRDAGRALDRDELQRRLLQLLIDGGGLDEIVDAIGRRFGAPCLVLDHDGFVVVGSGADSITHLLADGGALASDGAITLDDSGRTVATTASGLNYLTARVASADQHFGQLVVFENDRPLEVADRGTLEVASTVAALAMRNRADVQRVEHRYRHRVLAELVGPDADLRGRAVAQASSIGWDAARASVVVVAEADEDVDPVATSRFVANIGHRVRVADRRAAIGELDERVVMILGAEIHADHVALVRSWQAETRTNCSFSFGISRPTVDAAGLRAAYDQACRAAEIGRQVDGGGHVTTFDSLGALRLLCLVPDTGELQSFMVDLLGPLADGTAEAAELRHTLAVLLDTNCSLAESARRLSFHYNTVRYRLDRLKSLVGPFTEDPALRLDLQLALAIARLHPL